MRHGSPIRDSLPRPLSSTDMVPVDPSSIPLGDPLSLPLFTPHSSFTTTRPLPPCIPDHHDIPSSPSSPTLPVPSLDVPARLPPRQKLLPRPVPTQPTPTLATRPSSSRPSPPTALASLQLAPTSLAADLASRRLQEQYHDTRLANPRKTLTTTARATSTAAALRLQTPSTTSPAFSPAVSQYVAEHSAAPSTVATYTAMWKQWTNYCETRGHATALPASLPVLADFLVSSALRDEQAKLSFSNTKLRLAAISYFHRLSGSENPCAHPTIQNIKSAARRRLGQPNMSKFAITRDHVLTMERLFATLSIGAHGVPTSVNDFVFTCSSEHKTVCAGSSHPRATCRSRHCG